MEKIKVYRETLPIRTCDCDMMGTWRPSAILTAMQEIAGAHSEALGCGRNALLQNGIVWVLTRSEVKMDRYPVIGDRVQAETFPMANRRWFFPRYYLFKNAQGDALGCAATLWALLDIRERRMVPPGDVAACIPDNSDLTAPMGLPGTVDVVAGEETVRSRMPAYFDLDVNGHVNNTRYADWACDALGIEEMRANCLASFRVNYDAEVLPHQEIKIHTQRDGLYFRVAGYHGDKLHFEMGGELRAR